MQLWLIREERKLMEVITKKKRRDWGTYWKLSAAKDHMEKLEGKKER